MCSWCTCWTSESLRVHGDMFVEGLWLCLVVECDEVL